MKREETALLQHFRRLGSQERETLMAFAEFLVSRCQPEAGAVEPPREIPRPTEETVVGAVKRLSATYAMLDKAKMLHETSFLMTQHIIHGRPAVEVIDELEQLFRRHYERLSVGEGGVS